MASEPYALSKTLGFVALVAGMSGADPTTPTWTLALMCPLAAVVILLVIALLPLALLVDSIVYGIRAAVKAIQQSTCT